MRETETNKRMTKKNEYLRQRGKLETCACYQPDKRRNKRENNKMEQDDMGSSHPE